MKVFAHTRLLMKMAGICLLLLPAMMQGQTDVRSKIDAERRDLNFGDEKAFVKSREYIRLDSTYYIGYMYQGSYFYERARDVRGYNLAIQPLEKALFLIEKDYDKQLRTRTNDIYEFLRVNAYQTDYCYIAYWLEQAYQNIEKPDMAFHTLERVRNRNLQFENGIETYNQMAWIYHRNRVYTSANYDFLKNSVHANDSMAYLYLDSALIKIQKDADLNVGIFDPNYVNRQAMFTYHYKAILFDHDLQFDSTEFYYNILLRSGYYSSNNYAEYQYTVGEFNNAEGYFIEAESRDNDGDRHTREYFYMRSHLEIYKGRPEMADSLIRQAIVGQEATPGYGWHTIALARALQYQGLNAESQEKINSAARFHEMHIGTTWGREQYNMAVATLDYTNKVRFAHEYKFENDAWWNNLNPYCWYRSSQYELQENQYKMIVANLLAENPERDIVVYPLFASENLINFDEVSQVIDGFGTDYFIGIYEELLEKDQRPNLKKYFRYELGRLYLQKGEKTKANALFKEILYNTDSLNGFEWLLYARACEGMALTTTGAAQDYWVREMYYAYPELVPFSDLRMKFRINDDWKGSGSYTGMIWGLFIFAIAITFILVFLHRAQRLRIKRWMLFIPAVLLLLIGGGLYLHDYNLFNTNPEKLIAGDLQQCAIDFTDDADAPLVDFTFQKQEDAIEVNYSVTDNVGTLKQQGTLRIPNDKISDGGKLLAYRLFGVKKTEIGDEPEPQEKDEEMKKDSVK
jgi:hypothetical protein